MKELVYKRHSKQPLLYEVASFIYNMSIVVSEIKILDEDRVIIIYDEIKTPSYWSRGGTK